MNTLGVFAKYPVPGRVKTRLARDIGAECAAQIYEAFVRDLVDRFGATADRRVLAYSPESLEARNWFGPLAATAWHLQAQVTGDLGTRMTAFFRQAFTHGSQRVVLIGSDSPTIPASLIREAFDLLDSHDVVLGPATDGGYYLVGQSGQSRDIFRDVEWSRSSVLSQTIRSVAETGLSLALTSPWYDVDTASDLEMLKGHLAAMKLAASGMLLPRTESLLDRKMEPHKCSVDS